jgi:16S rRNA (adenine1518-N6/adenine1519-N6)-dimethyltransferase
MSQIYAKPRKSLGQNFLKNPAVVQRIVEALEVKAEDAILEIGCGTGALTARLAGRSAHYMGIEIDPRLMADLRQQWSTPEVQFTNQDILKTDFDRLRQEWPGMAGGIKVVGNLPYYISSPILEHLGRYSHAIRLAVVMLQAEVADRLQAQPGQKAYGVLTLMVQLDFKVEELFTVPPSAFFPRPKIFSKVVRLTPHESPLLPRTDRLPLFSLIKQAFSQRRKTLVNCLKGSAGADDGALPGWLKQQGLPPDVRAERLSLGVFIQLLQLFK